MLGFVHIIEVIICESGVDWMLSSIIINIIIMTLITQKFQPKDRNNKHKFN